MSRVPVTFRRVIRGGEDDRIRACWRITIPIVLTIVGLLGVSLVGVGVSQTTDVAAAVMQALIYLSSAAVVAGLLVVSARYLDRRPIQAYGFALSRGWSLDFVAGAALGVLLVGGLFVATRALGWVEVLAVASAPVGSFPTMLLLFALGYAAVGFWEEALFRGVFITNAAEGLRARAYSPGNAVLAAWVVSSIVFGVGHLLFLSLPAGVPLATTVLVWISMGGLLGLAYVSTGQLAFPIGLHFTFNFAVNNVFFNLPDHRAAGIPGLLTVEISAPELWHPVGGLSLLLVVLLGYLATLGWLYWRQGGDLTVQVLDQSGRR